MTAIFGVSFLLTTIWRVFLGDGSPISHKKPENFPVPRHKALAVSLDEHHDQ
jgi:hypothetical protein